MTDTDCMYAHLHRIAIALPLRLILLISASLIKLIGLYLLNYAVNYLLLQHKIDLYLL